MQQLPGRLVTTPQTVQSFIDQLAVLGKVRVLSVVTLVTLDCSSVQAGACRLGQRHIGDEAPSTLEAPTASEQAVDERRVTARKRGPG